MGGNIAVLNSGGGAVFTINLPDADVEGSITGIVP